MSAYRVATRLAGADVTYDVVGDRLYGGDEVLLDKDDDLTARRPWAGEGYVVAPFLGERDMEAIREGFRRIMESHLCDAGAPTRLAALEHYHRHVEHDGKDRHAEVVERIRHGVPVDHFPIPFDRVTGRIAEICGLPLQVHNPTLGKSLFSLRVVRPGRRDFNPPHRDVWLDRLRNAVNIYVPLAGSTAASSLCLVPGSHLWKESEIERTAKGAQVDGVVYTVPAVTGSTRPFELIRPNPAPGEVLVFSPYLIHGGAANLGEVTRVSLEVRFWRKP